MKCANCKDCECALWQHIEENTFNLLCGKMSSKPVDLGITKEENVMTPSWCPNIGSSNIMIHPIYGTPVKKQEESKTQKIITIREMWDNMTPQVKWDEIKVGERYHIPPYLGSVKRHDIEIVFKCSTYLSYKEVGGYATSYVYPNDLEFKVMVKQKK